MKRYVLYAHGGSKNHGCEALVRSTVSLLNVARKNVRLVSSRPEHDEQYGIDTLVDIIPFKSRAPVTKKDLKFFKAYWNLKIKKDHTFMDMLTELAAVDAHCGDVAISIGGDNYCYDDVEVWVNVHKMWKFGGVKTVLWGCSVEPELLNNPIIREDIQAYDLITARETISYEALRDINPNTVLVSDSAFFLDVSECPLPQGFVEGNTVGINLSPMILQYASNADKVFENYRNLIDHIINTTDMSVCLIPHVVREDSDDRPANKRLYDLFSNTGRVCMLEDHNAMELKGCISKCRFFIGARTHATIAAYSTCVPTLVMGYSVKSRGIAKDLFGTSDGYVLPVQNIIDSDDLIKAFETMHEKEDDIRSHLKEIMPSYKHRVFDGVDALRKL